MTSVSDMPHDDELIDLAYTRTLALLEALLEALLQALLADTSRKEAVLPPAALPYSLTTKSCECEKQSARRAG